MNKLINDKVIALLNYRIQQEEVSSRLYEQMYLYLEDKGYIVAAQVWKKFANEEMVHVQWAKDYLLAYGVKPELMDLDAPICEFEDLYDISKQSLEHEILITEQCNNLASEALKMNDHVLYSLAQKYLSEQIEEMDKTQTIVDMFETFGNSPEANLLIDKKLKKFL